MLPALYSFRRCPYAMRARYALALAGQNYILREVDLKNKPAHMLKLSQKGTVPVLFGPDLFLEESLDIVRWAMAQNPKAFHEGGDETLVARLGAEFIPSLNKYKYPERYDLQDITPFKAVLDAFLHDLDAAIKGPYLYGDKPSFTDIALFPLIRQMWIVNNEDFDAMLRPKFLAWFHAILKGPAFEKSMEKYVPWDEANPEEIIIRQ